MCQCVIFPTTFFPPFKYSFFRNCTKNKPNSCQFGFDHILRALSLSVILLHKIILSWLKIILANISSPRPTQVTFLASSTFIKATLFSYLFLELSGPDKSSSWLCLQAFDSGKQIVSPYLPDIPTYPSFKARLLAYTVALFLGKGKYYLKIFLIRPFIKVTSLTSII